ncbi:hypothetical protein [Niabella sp.]|uniref:hypothetical protein n=1 Tax=Niabella sp. TaxID=1962976 RepID=UPI002620D9FB|nr:hypothetical protein [Niabella sp.]
MSNLDNFSISTYIIGSKDNIYRTNHVEEQFSDKEEFSVVHELGPDISATDGHWNWQNLYGIIEHANSSEEDDLIIICRDNHEFAPSYNKTLFLENVVLAYELGADILLGGVINFDDSVRINENLFWLNEFNEPMFMVIYRKFFKTILEIGGTSDYLIDYLIATNSKNIMITYPFVSVSRCFGPAEKVESIDPILFFRAERRFKFISDAYRKYILAKNSS